jgi:hypothetical protein
MDTLLRHAILCIAFGLAFTAWFVFMAFFTSRHARVTGSENSFWVRMGLMSATTAAKVARIEKSVAFKALYAVLALAFFILGARYLMLRTRLRSHLLRASQKPLAILGHETTKSSNQSLEPTAGRRTERLKDEL